MSRKTFYTVFKTKAGWLGLLASSTGLLRTTLPRPTKEDAREALKIEDARKNSRLFHDLVQRLKHYFAGQTINFTDKLDISNYTPFQRAVWQAARKIPYGQTRRYAWIAQRMGKPGAARAVGQALRRNPVPIIVPCHRVIYSNGSLGGFAGGLALKKDLLVLEKYYSPLKI